MIIGLILRNFKVYKNLNFIPLSNGASFSGIIGVNGVGKSSVLEALDCFFNDTAQWIDNIHCAAKDDESYSVSPIFMIEKTELTDVTKEDISIESIAAYSDAVWEMIMGSMPPEVISNNYKQYAQCLKETILSISFASKDTHYLLPIGLTRARKNCVVFKGDYLRSLVQNETECSGESLYDIVADEYIKGIYKVLRDKYEYIYVSKDIQPERFVRFETEEIQTLLGEDLQSVVSKSLSKKSIETLSRNLKSYVDNLSNLLDGYKFKTPSSRQPNLKPSGIYRLIIKEFFSLRELHKSNDGVDLPMSQLSSGEKQQALLSLIHSIIVNYRKKDSELIIAVDEPESSLHISACYDQFEKLYQISEKCSQILFSSHWYGFIPAMLSGSVIHLCLNAGKYNTTMLNIAKYREEIKVKERESGKEFHQPLPLDIMLKSSNDFIQSILSGVLCEQPYNWLLCEGSSELVYFRHYFKDELKKKKLRIIPVGGVSEIKKIYERLALMFSELGSNIKGNVVMIVDTDSQLFEFETKDIKHLYCKRLINIPESQKTQLVNIRANPKAPKTEIEDVLNGKVFYNTLKSFAEKYAESLNFVDDNAIKEEIPSYFALDLKPSEQLKLDGFFNIEVGIKVAFAKKYVENCSENDVIPSWVEDIKGMLGN